MNNQVPSKKNTFFNWQVPDWQTKPLPNQGFCTIGPIITSPFFRLDNLELLRTTKDMKWDDGWELLYRRVGLKDDNSLDPSNDPDLGVLLYNKYTGLLRVLLKTCRLEDYQTVRIELKFSEQSAFKTDLLELSRNTIGALDKSFTPTELVATSKFVNNSTKWFYADFPMVYDPCTPLYKSKIDVTAWLVSQSQININGTLNGNIFTQNVNNKAEVNGDKNYTFNTSNLLQAGSKFFSVNDSAKFMTGLLNYGSQLTSDNSSNSWQPYAFGQTLNFLTFLKTGLKNNNYINGAIKMLDFFVSGGKKAENPTQKVEVMPMSISMTAKLNGTIEKTSKYNNYVFNNPGSKDVELDVDNYPYYNEVLGIFNLLQTPEVLYERSTEETLNSGFLYSYLSCPPYSPPYNPLQQSNCTPLNVNVDRFKLIQNSIKYVLNPAAEVEIQDMQFQFVIDGELFYNYYQNDNFTGNNKIMLPDFEYSGVEFNEPNNKKFKFRSPLLFAKSFCQRTFAAFSPRSLYEPNPGYSSPPNAYNNKWSPWRPKVTQVGNTSNVYLKIFLNLKRKNTSATTQNIAYVMTYPVKIIPSTYLKYNFSHHNFPTYIPDDESLIDSATPTEVATFCTLAPYFTADRWTRMTEKKEVVLSDIAIDKNIKIISIIPNPSNGNFSMRIKSQSSLLKSIQVFDVLGRLITTQYLSIDLKNGFNKIFQFNLQAGTYFIKINTDKEFFSEKLIIQK